MKEKNELYEIINSLTKSEKRYLNLAFSGGNGKNYLKLFQEIRYHSENNLPYNDSVIKEKYRGEKFTKQLTFTKNYLTELIFKTLDSYYGNSSTDLRIKNLLVKARIQYDKALYKNFFRTIESGKKLCRDYERLAQHLMFLEMEKVIIIKKISPGRDESAVLNEEVEILNKLRNLNEYEQIINSLTRLYRDKGRLRDTTSEALVKKINDNYIMMNEARALTTIAKERFYFIRQLIADLEGNYSVMVENINHRYLTINENPEPFGERLFNHMQDIIMYILIFFPISITGFGYEKFRKLLREYSGSSETEKITLFLIESAVKLSSLKGEISIEVLLNTIREIELKMASYKDKMDSNYEILIYSSASRVLASRGNFSEASVYVNKLLNHPDIFIRKDIELYSKLINIIIHYELKNYDYLEHLIKSLYRYLLKRGNLYRFEKLIIIFFRRLTRVTNDNELLENLELIRNEVLDLKNDRFERNALSFFDFPGWINKKIAELEKGNAGPV